MDLTNKRYYTCLPTTNRAFDKPMWLLNASKSAKFACKTILKQIQNSEGIQHSNNV